MQGIFITDVGNFTMGCAELKDKWVEFEMPKDNLIHLLKRREDGRSIHTPPHIEEWHKRHQSYFDHNWNTWNTSLQVQSGR